GGAVELRIDPLTGGERVQLLLRGTTGYDGIGLAVDDDRIRALHRGHITGYQLTRDRLARLRRPCEQYCRRDRGGQCRDDLEAFHCRTSHHAFRCVMPPASPTGSTLPLERCVSLLPQLFPVQLFCTIVGSEA